MTQQDPVVAVVDYGIGNLHSAHKALLSVGANACLSDDPETIRRASAVVLPGVGNFGACMTALRARGLEDPVLTAVSSGQPFLGICVGMQMLFDGSDESPEVSGLGVIPGRIERLPDGVKRPQMQWNQLEVLVDDPVLGTPDGEGEWMYFVHSYSARPADPSVIAATVNYGGPVVAVCRREQVLATQFHPEKSSISGLAFLRRWVDQIGALSA